MQIEILRYKTFLEKIALIKKYERDYCIENLGNGILMLSKSVELI